MGTEEINLLRKIASYEEVKLSKILKELRLTLAVAESITGGLLSKRITDVSGSSVYFLGGVVAYSRFAKEALLGVPKELIDKYGTVSREIVEALAWNVRDLFKSEIGIAITGIAGPDTIEGKPVGLVYVGIATRGNCSTFMATFKGKREVIRENAVDFVLEKTILLLRGG